MNKNPFYKIEKYTVKSIMPSNVILFSLGIFLIQFFCVKKTEFGNCVMLT